MKVAWFDAEEWEKEYLQNVGDLEIEFFEDSLTEDTVEKADGFDAVTVFVNSQVSEAVIEELDPDMIACRSTGFDHVDLEAANRNGIAVCNVPDYGSVTVAEHAFGLLLALSRKIYYAIRKVDQGEFNHEGLRGFDLEGKKLGVIGTGDIGQKMIELAKGFNMEVIASDPQPDRDAARELGFMYVSMEDLLEQADIISLHCPLVEQTRHLLSEEEFEKMEGTLIVNTARGELIDTEALIKALENGSVEAAGLDVLEGECYLEDDIEVMGDLSEECDLEVILEDHILMDRDDVLVTPHNAFNSREALERIEDTTLENLREKKNIVNSP